MFPVENIRAACRARGITIFHLEKALNLGNGSIGKWEHAKRSPPHDRLLRIAEYLEVPIEQLTGEQNKPATDGGLEEAQLELIRLIPDLSPAEAQVLLAAAKAQVALRRGQDKP